MGALFAEGEEDYALEEGQQSVWITVGNLSVYVVRTDCGVKVEVYDLGNEAEGSPLAGCEAYGAEEDEVLSIICHTDRLPKCRSFG